jgi:PAS domain S-box-containing protein
LGEPGKGGRETLTVRGTEMAAGKKAAPDKINTGSTRTIRDSAEKKLGRTPGKLPEFAGQLPEELIHELRVQQVELETQAKELRRAQLDLEESRDKYLDLYDFAPVGYLTLNDTALITNVNLTCAKLLGVERKKLLMAQFRKFIAPEDYDQWYKYFIKTRQRVKKQSHTLTLRRGEGSVFPARLEGIRVTDSAGAISVHIVISDITDIRQAEEALRESEDRFRNVINAANAYVFEIDAHGTITFLSDRVKDILGYEPQELIGKTPFDTMTSPEEVARVSLIFGEYQKNKLPIRHMEHNCRSKDGRELVLTVTALPRFGAAGEITGYQGTVEDITRRKLAEDLIKESQERYVSLFDRSMDCLYLHDFEGNFIDANPAALELLGYSKEDIPCLNFTSLISDEYLGRAHDTIRMILETGTQSAVVQYRLRCKSGEYVDIETKGSLVFQKGKPYAVLGIARDITERKRAEEALRESEERFRLLLQHVPSVAVQGYSMEGTTQYWNEASERFYGYTSGEAIGKNLVDLIVPPEMQEEVRKAMTYMAETGKPIPASELSLMRKDGTRVAVFSSHAIIKNSGGEMELFCIDIDLSVRKLAEDTLLRVNQKLNVLSELTRKDLTSQILVLNGYLELAKNHAAGQERVLSSIEKSKQAAQAINDITEITRDYQDMGAKSPKWQNVEMALLLGLSHVSIGEIRHSIETENLEIFADPLLEKVCQRLFENSVKHGGHITRIRVWHKVTPNGVTIVFEDDGTGIPQERKEQIFLRSGGTRVSRGSLIFVRDILDITGITIRETGEPGKGARFVMEVPEGAFRFSPVK